MSEQPIVPTEASGPLLEELSKRGLDVFACYQCGKCSSGCPLAPSFDLLPMEVIRLASYGMEAPLMESHTIWLCASCETCSTRCPNDIDIAGVMDALRQWCLTHGHKPAEKRIALFHESFLRSLKRHGRLYELGMLASYKIRSGDLFSDMGLGLSMMGKGKISFKPHSIKGKLEIKEIFERAKKEKKK